MAVYEKDDILYWENIYEGQKDVQLYNRKTGKIDYREFGNWTYIDFYELDNETIKKMLISLRYERNKDSFKKTQGYISDLRHILDHRDSQRNVKNSRAAILVASLAIWVDVMFRMFG